MPPLSRFLPLVFLAWTAIALVAGFSDLALLHLLGRAKGVTWWELFHHPLVEQWTWAALTPVVLWWAGRVPLRRPGLPRAFLLHLAMYVVLCFVHAGIAQALDEPERRAPGVLFRALRESYSDLWMYWPLVGLRALLEAQARRREREREAERLERLTADLRLSLLRAQIQPHFLFNTLHAISALLRTDPHAADELVADLAEILRASFADGAPAEVPLAREAELVACYLRIQQHRFGDRLRVRWDVDEAARGTLVPALALQSVVENAVVHGLAPSPRGGTLEIAARRTAEGALQLVVRDDGVGLAPAHRDGVGLSNTRERLAQLHGDAASLALEGAPGAGTSVTLTLPWRDAPMSHADPADPHADRGRRAAGAAEPRLAA